MDSVNSDDQRLFTEALYNLYISYLGVLMFITVPLREVLGPFPFKPMFIPTILFLINFSAAWCAMESAPEVPYRHPLAFNTIFYGTMILAPGFLLYRLKNLHEALTADEFLLQYMEP